MDDETPPEVREWYRQLGLAHGRSGGLKGGPARAKKLSKMRRAEIAQHASRMRWAKVRAQRALDATGETA